MNQATTSLIVLAGLDTALATIAVVAEAKKLKAVTAALFYPLVIVSIAVLLVGAKAAGISP